MTTPSQIDVSTLREGETKAAHTPGPWEAQAPDICDYGGVAIIGLRVNPDGSAIHTPTNGIVAYAAMFPTEIDREDTSRAEANARLIAAAPDLLAALKTLDAWWTSEFPDGPAGPREWAGGIGRLSDDTILIWSKVRAAIAKAGA